MNDVKLCVVVVQNTERLHRVFFLIQVVVDLILKVKI